MYVFERFYQRGNLALNNAIEFANSNNHPEVDIGHLLFGILSVDGVQKRALEKSGVEKWKVEELVKRMYSNTNKHYGELTPRDFSPRLMESLNIAESFAAAGGYDKIGISHLLLGILGSKSHHFFENNVIKADRNEISKTLKDLLDEQARNEADDIERASSEKYGKNLTDAAKNGEIDPVIGRETEIRRVIQTLSRRTKNNPVLVGEPGVGKTAIVEGLALAIANNKVPKALRNKKVLSVDLTSMVAGARYRGDFEERIKETIDKAIKDKNTILFIDELHTIIGAGAGEGTMDAANILKPSLARGDIQVIGATTLKEYRKHIEKDAALERRFQPITVGEPTKEQCVEILKGLRPKYEEHHNVSICDDAITSAVELSTRYITDRFLPDKAIDLIDEASSKVRLDSVEEPQSLKDIEEKISAKIEEKNAAVSEQNYELAAQLRDEQQALEKTLGEEREKAEKDCNETKVDVTAETIAKIVSDWTGVPVVQLTKQESERLLDLEKILHNRVIGQDKAVSSIAKAIRRGRVGLKDPNRPVGSFIFMGPTGVGKTELCKALSEAMFGDEKAIIRLDMSEYMEKHTVSKLIGSPPGYVGFDDGGQLTEKIRRKPYSVVLFDEIEKAHPDVFNILLQILDDGRLTDSQGRTVDFKNSVIIMTSNVGARKITEKQNSLGFASDGDESNKDTTKLVMEELKSVFRPEFLNRIDEIIVFDKLTKEDTKKIVSKMLETLTERLHNNKINISFSNSTLEKIAKDGFDEVYGARPLKREIQSKIEDKIAEKMLSGEIKAGDDVFCDVKDDEFFFETKADPQLDILKSKKLPQSSSDVICK